MCRRNRLVVVSQARLSHRESLATRESLARETRLVVPPHTSLHFIHMLSSTNSYREKSMAAK